MPLPSGAFGMRIYPVKEKFTKYCLDLESENQDAKIKAEMFAEILGIKKNDWRYLHDLVLAGLQKYRPVRKNMLDMAIFIL